MKNKLLVVLIVVCCVLTGCLKENYDTDSEKMLNERQQDILKEMGLSMEYEELTFSQQKAITTIEEMLVYAENKYNASFSYAGYVPKSSLEKEHMRAYPTNGDKEYECFTIVKNESGFEDDYINLLLQDEFSSYIMDEIQDIYIDYKMKVFTDITKTVLMAVPENKKDFDNNVESSMYIFLEKESSTTVNFETLTSHLESFLKSHNLYGMVRIIILKNDTIQYLTKHNYTDYFANEYCIAEDEVYLNRY